MEVRWVVTSVLRFFFMYTAILSMLLFHHSSFRVSKKQGQVAANNRRSSVFTAGESEF
jgi:hypothetical protein